MKKENEGEVLLLDFRDCPTFTTAANTAPKSQEARYRQPVSELRDVNYYPAAL